MTSCPATCPCDFPAAQTIKLKVAPTGPDGGSGGVGGTAGGATGGTTGGGQSKLLVASGEFEPSEVQDLAELVPQLLDFRAKAKVPLRFFIRIEVGDGINRPSPEVAAELNKLLDGLKKGFDVV